MAMQQIPTNDQVKAKLADAELYIRHDGWNGGSRLDLRNHDLGYNRAGLFANQPYALRRARFDECSAKHHNFDGSNLSSASFRKANLRYSTFRNCEVELADFTDADLTGAVFTGCKLNQLAPRLTEKQLLSLDMTETKNDLFAVLAYAPGEVAALLKAIDEGKVDGSTYAGGDCGCLVGTLAKAATGNYGESLPSGLEGNSARPIERLFMSISKGDMPKSSLEYVAGFGYKEKNANPVSALVRKWVAEWQTRHENAFKAKPQQPAEYTVVGDVVYQRVKNQKAAVTRYHDYSQAG